MDIEKTLIELCVDVIQAKSIQDAYFSARTRGDVLEANKQRALNITAQSSLKNKAEAILDKLVELDDNQLKLVEY